MPGPMTPTLQMPCKEKTSPVESMIGLPCENNRGNAETEWPETTVILTELAWLKRSGEQQLLHLDPGDSTSHHVIGIHHAHAWR